MNSIGRSELIYRLGLFLIALATQIQLQITATMDNPSIASLSRWKYLTNQANLLGIIWLGLFLWWRNDPEKIKRIRGKFHGAVVTYLALVMVAYHFLLSQGDPGFWTATNISVHYIVPTGFIIGWFLWERADYEWSFLKIWIIFPLYYAIFALTLGLTKIDTSYVYEFLNVDENGWSNTLTFIFYIFVGYLLISAIFISSGQKLSAKDK